MASQSQRIVPMVIVIDPVTGKRAVPASSSSPSSSPPKVVSLNTHFYDHLLTEQTKLILLYLEGVEYSKEERVKILSACELNDPRAKRNLQVIIKSIGTAANKDPVTGLVTDDLLMIAHRYQLLTRSSWLLQFEEQLIDMSTGFCVQGRNHRILQILLPYLDK